MKMPRIWTGWVALTFVAGLFAGSPALAGEDGKAKEEKKKSRQQFVESLTRSANMPVPAYLVNPVRNRTVSTFTPRANTINILQGRSARPMPLVSAARTGGMTNLRLTNGLNRIGLADRLTPLGESPPISPPSE
jgi:hypothetical protein